MEISLTSSARCRTWHDVRVLYFQFLVVAAVFGAIAWVAAGRGGGLEDPRQDRPEPALTDDRQLGKDDIDGARFAVGFRGYRMDQVDRLLDRLAAEIDHRDRLIAELTQPAGERFGEGVGYEPVARPSEAAASGEAASAATAATAGTAPTITAEPGFGPGVASPREPEDAAGRDRSGPDQGSADNPLSAWYRPTDQEQ
ncbi:MAG: DivIVA domain-containing protein [Catenulispora sp.]|nr:DivIVA domain-containing protein [Catenulispora sp.]